MEKIVLDTSVLLSIFELKIDLLEEIRKAVNFNYEVFILEGTKDELAEDAMKYRCHVLTIKEDKATVESGLSGLRSAQNITFVDQASDGTVTFEIQSSFQSTDIWQEIDALNKEKNWPVKSFSERTFNLEDMFIALLSKDKEVKSGI